jgi:hypothetical protein
MFSAENNSRNKIRTITSVRSVPRGYEKDKEDRLSQLSFETLACQHYELGSRGVELRNHNY